MMMDMLGGVAKGLMGSLVDVSPVDDTPSLGTDVFVGIFCWRANLTDAQLAADKLCCAQKSSTCVSVAFPSIVHCLPSIVTFTVNVLRGTICGITVGIYSDEIETRLWYIELAANLSKTPA